MRHCWPPCCRTRSGCASTRLRATSVRARSGSRGRCAAWAALLCSLDCSSPRLLRAHYALIDRAEDTEAGVVEHLDAHLVAELQERSGDLAFLDLFQHATLGDTCRAA